MNKTLLGLVEFLYTHTNLDKIISGYQENPSNGREIIKKWLLSQISEEDEKDFTNILNQYLKY